jgi:hypothetical protein
MMLANPRFWLVLLVSALLAYSGGRWQQSRADAAKYDGERTKAALSAAVDQVKAVDRARAEEQRRTAAQTEIANAAIQNAKAAQADARAADAARRELLARATALANAARRPGDSDAVGGSAPAFNAADLLADVLGKIDQRAQEVAEFADAAHIAGQACERSYDSLTNGAAK